MQGGTLFAHACGHSHDCGGELNGNGEHYDDDDGNGDDGDDHADDHHDDEDEEKGDEHVDARNLPLRHHWSVPLLVKHTQKADY